MSDDKKVIFSMNRVSKTYQSAGKQVLKDIYFPNNINYNITKVINQNYTSCLKNS